MKPIFALARDFLQDTRGATAVEYCLIAAMISMACVTAATTIGQSVLGFFQQAAAGFTP